MIDMRGKRVKVISVEIGEGVDCLPFTPFDTHEENLEFSRRYIGKTGMAQSIHDDGRPSDEYIVTFDDGKIGSFVDYDLEIVKD